MYECVYIYIYIYIYTNVCIYIYIYIYMCMYVCMYVYIYIYICTMIGRCRQRTAEVPVRRSPRLRGEQLNYTRCSQHMLTLVGFILYNNICIHIYIYIYIIYEHMCIMHIYIYIHNHMFNAEANVRDIFAGSLDRPQYRFIGIYLLS